MLSPGEFVQYSNEYAIFKGYHYLRIPISDHCTYQGTIKFLLGECLKRRNRCIERYIGLSINNILHCIGSKHSLSDSMEKGLLRELKKDNRGKY